MRVLVVFYLWVNFVLVKRSPASKFTSQYLTYLVECFVSCCVFPYTFWYIYIGAGLQILLCATSQHKHHTSSPRIIHLFYFGRRQGQPSSKGRPCTGIFVLNCQLPRSTILATFVLVYQTFRVRKCLQHFLPKIFWRPKQKVYLTSPMDSSNFATQAETTVIFFWGYLWKIPNEKVKQV